MITDECEEAIVEAFLKEGWTILERQFLVRYGDHRGKLYIDLRLQHTNEDKAQHILIVEVKCFQGDVLREFYQAVGQYMLYQQALWAEAYDEDLFLAVPKAIYDTFFQAQVIQEVIKAAKIKIVVVDLAIKELAEWLP